MKKEGKSWKYTSVIKKIDEGEYVKSINAGNGDEIRIFKHTVYEFSSISQVAKNEFNGDEKLAYYNYIDKIFRTTNAQSSIRKRIMEETKDINSDLISIEYIPCKGKNAGQVTKLYYKDKVRNLVAFLRDVVSVQHDGIYKLDNKGNIWDDINYNNLANEAGISFPNGQKPIQLLKDIIKMFNDEESIILDFFSGSATTAHATMKLNSEDGGKRKFIMVQLPELTDEKSEFNKAGYKNICEIGKERIRRAGIKIKEEVEHVDQNIDVGFRVLKLDSTNMKDVYYKPDEYELDLFNKLADNIKEDRTASDLLFQVMLDLGVLLSSKIDETIIDGKKIFNVADGFLMACFDEDVTEETIKIIAQQKPYYFIMRDSSMANDSVATNFEQIFTTYSPDTVRKVL